MSHVSHRSTLPPPPDRVGRLTGTAALSVHATSIAGDTQRDPEGTSREPRRRGYGHRRGISLPKALYQNAARMSRGAEGTTEASGRRDQAGLAARKRRVGAVRGAVPAQNEPKSDRPRAKTPINRRKSRLRRRAAPISFFVSGANVLSCGIQGARYEPDADTADRWIRRPLGTAASPTQVELKVPKPGARETQEQRIWEGRARINAVFRPRADGHLATVSLVNAQNAPSGGPGRQIEQMLFQCRFRTVTEITLLRAKRPKRWETGCARVQLTTLYP